MDDQARDLYLQRFGAKSTIFIPLVVGGQWIGFINGIYQQATTFPEPEVRRLMGLSGQAAAVIQGLRQLQEIQARARREALIRTITGKIRATTDLETILQTTVTEVSRALGTSHAAIHLGSHAPEEYKESLGSEHGNGADAPANQSQPNPPSPPQLAEKGGQG
jgi:GAF domain-containing protein